MLRLASSEAVAAQIRVRERLHFGELCRSGFFFCVSCQKVTEKIGDDLNKCCWCGSMRVKWFPAVIEDEQLEAVQR